MQWGDPPEPEPTVPTVIEGTSTTTLFSPTGRAGKSQRWAWWTGSRWDAVLPTTSGWRIFTDVTGDAVTGASADSRTSARVDTLYEDGHLWVARGHSSSPRISRYECTDGQYHLQTTVNLPTLLAASDGDASPLTLHRTPNGRLWVACVSDAGQAMVAISDNDGDTWSAAGIVAAGDTGVATMTHNGDRVILFVTLNEGWGRHVRTIDQGASSILSTNWATESVPDLPSGITSDDHGMAASIGGHIYIASKTTGSMSDSEPLIYLLHRDDNGDWSQETLRGGPDTPGLVRPTRPTLVATSTDVHVAYGNIGPTK